MALLTSPLQGSRARTTALRATLAAGLLVLAGCILNELLGGDSDQGPVFPHRVHVVDQGFDCAICHEPAEGADRPSMPALESCSLCHDGLDEEKPPERRADALYTEGVLRPGVLALSSEIRFSHAAHVEYTASDCNACHVGMDESERVTAADVVTMDDCTACHAANDVDPSCATCHSQVDRDFAPPSHERAWLALHGEVSLAKEAGVANRCDLCHEQSSCNQCHNEVAPASHNGFWRLRGHAIPASLDRQDCAVCHRDDFCTRCHEETPPLSHSASFGSLRNNHCLTCHFPLSNEGCFTCHKSTPSHQLGAPQPPDHQPGANCRLCHGFQAPLPHVDDGSQCSLCHP